MPDFSAFAVDFDRTLTGTDHRPDSNALAAIQQLRQAGIRCILVTGRSHHELAAFPELANAFDAYVLEGGAEWGNWTERVQPSNAKLALDAADRMEQEGIQVVRRSASFGCPATAADVVARVAQGCSTQRNVDTIDVLPPGVDKGYGLDGALSQMGWRSAQVTAIGDAENDIPMFERANVALAVANAQPAAKAAADVVLAGEGPAGVIEAAQRLLRGEWSKPADSVPGAP